MTIFIQYVPVSFTSNNRNLTPKKRYQQKNERKKKKQEKRETQVASSNLESTGECGASWERGVVRERVRACVRTLPSRTSSIACSSAQHKVTGPRIRKEGNCKALT